MKNYTLLIFLVASLIFTSCSKDNNNSDNPEEAFDMKSFEAKLVGTWRLQSELKNGESIVLDDCTKQSNITVAQNNGDFVHSYYDFNVSLDECTLEGSPAGRISAHPDEPTIKLVMDYSDGNGSPIYTYSISDTSLKLIWNMDNGETSKTYIKQ